MPSETKTEPETEESVIRFHTRDDASTPIDASPRQHQPGMEHGNTTAEPETVPGTGTGTGSSLSAAGLMKEANQVTKQTSDHIISMNQLESSSQIITAGKEEVVMDTSEDKKEEEKKAASTCDDPPVSIAGLFRYAQGWDYVYLVMGVLGAVASGASLPGFSILFGYLMNALNESGDIVGSVRTYSFYFIYVGIGVGVASWAEVAMFMMSAENQCVRIRNAYVAAILRQEMGWHDKQTAGELTSRLATDTKNIQDALGTKLANYLHHLSSFIGGLVIGFIYGWQLALLILGMTPLLAVAGAAFAVMMGKMAKEGAISYAEAGAIASEVISAMRTVTTFGGQKYEETRYVDKLNNAMNIAVKKQFMHGASMGVTMLVIFGTYGLALWFGCWLIYTHVHNPRSGVDYTGGDISTVFFSVLMAAMALGQGAPNLPAIQMGQTSAAKLFALIDRKSPIDPLDENVGEKLESMKGKVEFKDVTFAYPTRSERVVLQNFNLTVQAGETVALVGASGCGKSTIVALLERFYDPNEGSIHVDGHDIQGLNVPWWRQQVGLVQQEPLLFATSIGENIAYGKAGATPEEIEAAATAANAHHFITQFPKGYATSVGEEGRLLSGGQKQRVAIARAIIKSPALLLLDEATSALDTENEAIVQAALDELMRKKSHTTFVIAHRLTTVRRCDRIIVLDGGVIQEMGSHEDLIQRHGAYYHFVAAQAKRSADDVGSTSTDTLDEAKQSQASSSPLSAPETPKSNSTADLSKAKELIESKHVLVPMKEEVVKVAPDEEKKPVILNVPVSKIFKYNAPDWYWFVLGCFGAAAQGVALPMFSLIFAGMVTTFYEPDVEHQKFRAAQYAGLFAGLGGAMAVASLFQFGFIGMVGERMTKRLRHESFQSLLRQHIGWYDDASHNTGTLVTQLAHDAAQVNGLTSAQLSQMLQALAMVVASLTIAFVNGWKLALVVLAAGPCITFAGWAQMKFLGGFSTQSRDAAERAGAVANESITNIRTVASFNAERPLLRSFDAANQINRAIGYRTAVISGTGFGFSQFFLFLTYALCFLYGATLIEDGDMSFQEVMNVFFAIITCAVGVGQAGQLAPDYQKAKRAANAIFHLIGTKSEIDSFDESGDKLDITKGEVVFDNVSFVYPTRLEAPIFKGFSLRVPSKKKMALVGASGSGKSTIIALLQRFYDVNEGRILVDGQDIRSLNIQHYRSQIGVVSQEPVLFAASILDNIRYGKRNASMEAVIAAAKLANIHHVIDQLPDKYNTKLGLKGAMLSGGQKQRVAIARAILCKPAILLLDEATSALDSESEHLVQTALDNVSNLCTTIIIAHRLSTIRNAELIAVMERGMVVEGPASHDTLMSLHGSYYHLVNVYESRAGM